MKALHKTLLPVALLALWTSAAAAQPEGAAPAFSGRIEAGAAYINTTDPLFARGDRTADDLDGPADASGAVLPVALFDLRYRSEASGTEVFLGTPLETSTVRLTLGVGRSWQGVGTVTAAALADPWAEVWKDPYRVGAERDATGAPEYGGRVGWEGIAGTGAGISYTGMHTRVDDDAAGERLEALRRSGWTHEIELGYQVPLLPGLLLTPSVATAVGDLDGTAEAFRRYEGKLSVLLARERFMAHVFLATGCTRYREEHPDFGERRHDGSLGGGAMVTVPRLFGVPSLFADLVASYGVRDSNLGFFDARTTVAAVALGYAL